MRTAAVIAGIVLACGASAADTKEKRAPLPPAYVEECGSCHVAYPARMLDARSWEAVLAGLDRHFGVDATADPDTLAPIRAYLEASARRKPTTGADHAPLLRISETRWWLHEHDEVPARLWREPHAIRPADCAACHREAASGSYAERDIRMPKKEVAK